MARKARQPHPQKLSLLEKKLGYSFRNRAFPELALTHPSFTVEEFTDNERLEFLGDSVLSLSTSEHLYRILPRSSEGELTRIKSSVVSTIALAQVSRRIGLAEFMRLGKGLGNRSALPDSVHANVTEAIFAAVYMDGGYLAAMDVIVRLLTPEIEETIAAQGSENAKSQLQELAQKELGCSPRYKVVSESGPQHGKTFVVTVKLSGRSFPEFSGHTKKEAEQGAARLAMGILRDEKAPAAARGAARARPAAAKAAARRAPERRPGRKRRRARKKAASRPAAPKPASKPASRKPTPRKPAPRKPAPARGARRRKKRNKGTEAGKNPYDALAG